MDKALNVFFQEYHAAFAAVNAVPKVEFDQDWRSPCEVEEPTGGLVRWQLSERRPSGDFSGIERALEMSLHPDIKHYYGDFFGANMDAKTDRGGLQLLCVWNEDDFDRLLENLIGHVLMKRRLEQEETCFIALTDEDDWIISVLNSTGEVVLERIGQPHSEVLAANLSAFLKGLVPVVNPL